MKKLLIFLGLTVALLTNAQVGVGTDQPENTLHVEGDARITKMLEVQAITDQDTLVLRQAGTGVLVNVSIADLRDSLKSIVSNTGSKATLVLTPTGATTGVAGYTYTPGTDPVATNATFTLYSDPGFTTPVPGYDGLPIPSTTSPISLSGLSPSTTYYGRISDSTDPSLATAQFKTDTDRPGNIDLVKDVTTSGATVQYDYEAGTATGGLVSLSTSSGPAVEGNDMTIAISHPLQDGTEYTVSLDDSRGNLDTYSFTTSSGTIAGSPGSTAGSIDLNYTYSDGVNAGITGGNIQVFKREGGNSIPVPSKDFSVTPTTTGSSTVTGLDPGATYYFIIGDSFNPNLDQTADIIATGGVSRSGNIDTVSNVTTTGADVQYDYNAGSVTGGAVSILNTSVAAVDGANNAIATLSRPLADGTPYTVILDDLQGQLDSYAFVTSSATISGASGSTAGSIDLNYTYSSGTNAGITGGNVRVFKIDGGSSTLIPSKGFSVTQGGNTTVTGLEAGATYVFILGDSFNPNLAQTGNIIATVGVSRSGHIDGVSNVTTTGAGVQYDYNAGSATSGTVSILTTSVAAVDGANNAIATLSRSLADGTSYTAILNDSQGQLDSYPFTTSSATISGSSGSAAGSIGLNYTYSSGVDAGITGGNVRVFKRDGGNSTLISSKGFSVTQGGNTTVTGLDPGATYYFILGDSFNGNLAQTGDITATNNIDIPSSATITTLNNVTLTDADVTINYTPGTGATNAVAKVFKRGTTTNPVHTSRTLVSGSNLLSFGALSEGQKYTIIVSDSKAANLASENFNSASLRITGVTENSITAAYTYYAGFGTGTATGPGLSLFPGTGSTGRIESKSIVVTENENIVTFTSGISAGTQYNVRLVDTKHQGASPIDTEIATTSVASTPSTGTIPEIRFGTTSADIDYTYNAGNQGATNPRIIIIDNSTGQQVNSVNLPGPTTGSTISVSGLTPNTSYTARILDSSNSNLNELVFITLSDPSTGDITRVSNVTQTTARVHYTYDAGGQGAFDAKIIILNPLGAQVAVYPISTTTGEAFVDLAGLSASTTYTARILDSSNSNFDELSFSTVSGPATPSVGEITFEVTPIEGSNSNGTAVVNFKYTPGTTANVNARVLIEAIYRSGDFLQGLDDFKINTVSLTSPSQGFDYGGKKNYSVGQINYRYHYRARLYDSNGVLLAEDIFDPTTIVDPNNPGGGFLGNISQGYTTKTTMRVSVTYSGTNFPAVLTGNGMALATIYNNSTRTVSLTGLTPGTFYSFSFADSSGGTSATYRTND